MEGEKILKVQTHYGVMTIEIMDITPDTAADMLKMNICNRKQKRMRILGYVREMERNLWKENGAPIIFDDEGTLKDGQHRLEAIVESGLTAYNTIVVTVPKSQATCYDIGSLRTIRDVSKLEGYTDALMQDTHILHAASLMYQRTYKLKPSEISKLDIIKHVEYYHKSFEWGLAVFGAAIKGSHKSGVMATVLSAHINGEDETKLAHFVDVLKSGMAENSGDRTIITLRNYLLTAKRCGGSNAQLDAYFKAQRALNAYLKGQILTKIYSSEEYYIMPEVKQCQVYKEQLAGQSQSRG